MDRWGLTAGHFVYLRGQNADMTDTVSCIVGQFVPMYSPLYEQDSPSKGQIAVAHGPKCPSQLRTDLKSIQEAFYQPPYTRGHFALRTDKLAIEDRARVLALKGDVMMDKKATNYGFMDLILDVRDSGLGKHSELILLYALASRVNPDRGFSCFPSYELLCADTRLDKKTLQRAAAGLEKSGLLRREIRPNHSNVWWLNVEKIQKTAIESRGQAKQDGAWESPFGKQSLTSRFSGKAEAPTSSPSTSTSPKVIADDADAPKAIDQEGQQRIAELIREYFADHPTYEEVNADRIMHAKINEMVQMADSADECFDVLNHVFRSEEGRVGRIRKCNKLGAYLHASFPEWLASYRELTPGQEGERFIPDCGTSDGIMTLINEIWPGMSVFQEDLEACIKLAGSTERCGHILADIHYNRPEIREAAADHPDLRGIPTRLFRGIRC
jgi:hypothetical protein